MNKPIITGLITAAGLSERMKSFKPLNDFEGEPYITAITRKITPFCNKVIIVTGHKSQEINSVIKSRFLNEVIVLSFNPDYEKGMFTSLKKGIKETYNCDWVLYHFVDQPFFTNEFYEEFTSRINRNYDWIQPSYNDRMGHPILFNRKVLELILESPADSNLRIIKEDPSVVKSNWKCNYPEVLIDFDSEENIKEYYKIKK